MLTLRIATRNLSSYVGRRQERGLDSSYCIVLQAPADLNVFACLVLQCYLGGQVEVQEVMWCERVFIITWPWESWEERQDSCRSDWASVLVSATRLTSQSREQNSERARVTGQDWGLSTMAEEEGGAEDTSFLRTVSSPASHHGWYHAELADSFAGVDKFYSSPLLTINWGLDYTGGYKCFHFALTKHGESRTNDCLVAE